MELKKCVSATDNAIINYNDLFAGKTPTATEAAEKMTVLTEALQDEIDATLEDFFAKHLHSDNPIADILKKNVVTLPSLTKKKNDEGLVTHVERGKAKDTPVNVELLNDWAMDNGVLKTSKWMMLASQLQALIVAKAMKEVEADETAIKAVRSLPYISMIKDENLTTTQAVKRLQAVIDAFVMIPEEKKDKNGNTYTVNTIKARSIDVKFLELVCLTIDRKNSIRPVKAGVFYRMIAHVIHCILSGDKYDFNTTSLKADRVKAGRHFQIINYVDPTSAMPE